MTEIRVTKQTAVTFYGSFTLADLRTFLSQCDDVSGAARVSVDTYRGDQREGTSTTITVHGAA